MKLRRSEWAKLRKETGPIGNLQSRFTVIQFENLGHYFLKTEVYKGHTVLRMKGAANKRFDVLLDGKLKVEEKFAGADHRFFVWEDWQDKDSRDEGWCRYTEAVVVYYGYWPIFWAVPKLYRVDFARLRRAFTKRDAFRQLPYTTKKGYGYTTGYLIAWDTLIKEGFAKCLIL